MKERKVSENYPPDGTIIKKCSLCPHMMIDDGTQDKCLWCLIHKSTEKKGDKDER